ncbi:unnamed protein product [Diatraea saccharalis]|uniref:Uncharacterized protein n=1 Tax=Diatraea saccharalis TaxID=40085 RepID=A0A9N9R6M1_9NEOP|nr:unnamed protein product [Diatraea saccharalis]
MGELLVCRVCLCTDVKLYDIYKYRLESAYENLTGFKVLPLDGYPQYTCGVCSTLLTKWLSFKNLCQKSLEVLKFAYEQNHLITTEYVASLHLNTHILSNFSKGRYNLSYYDDETHIEDEICNKYEDNSNTDTNDLDFNNEEPNYETHIKIEHKPVHLLLSEKFTETKTKVKKKKVLKCEKKVFENNQDNEASESDSQDVDPFDNNDIELIILSKDQQMDEVRARMESLNYSQSLYKCNKCFKGFMSSATYKNHMVTHDPSTGSHVCEICQTRWPTVGKLRTHLTSHEKRYVCKLCGHVTKSRFKAKEHYQWHSGHKYICNICGASFEKSTSHLTHVRIHHPSQHSCEVCGESFIGENGLHMHRKKAHRSTENDEKKPTCSCCDVTFQTVEALKKHKAKNVDCSNIMPCVQCGENFETNAELKEHLKTHFKEEPVKCEECNRTFAHKRSFAIHFQRVHLGVKMKYRGARRQKLSVVVCEICGKECTSKATLMYHQRTHSGEKPYECPECPKRFSVHQRLQIHLRTHTGESPYKCRNCPKAFKHKAALNRHDRVHTGAKPYACSHCGKCFSQSNSMKLHVRTVHLKMPAPYRSRHTEKPIAT